MSLCVLLEAAVVITCPWSAASFIVVHNSNYHGVYILITVGKFPILQIGNSPPPQPHLTPLPTKYLMESIYEYNFFFV